MQSNMDDKMYKEFEDSGWSKMNQQLDIELPQKKKTDRGIILFLFFGLAMIAGYQYFSLNSNFNYSTIKGTEKNEINETKSTPGIEMEKAETLHPELIPDKSITKSEGIQSNSESINTKAASETYGKINEQPLAFTDTKTKESKVNSKVGSEKVIDKNTSKKSNSISFSKNKDIKNDIQTPISESEKSESQIIDGQITKADQSQSISSNALSRKGLSNKRTVYNIGSLNKPMSLLSLSDIRYTKAFLEVKNSESIASNSPILVSDDKMIKKHSGLFAETSLDYFIRKTVQNPAYFASTANVGYHLQVSNKFYITTQAGIVYPYSNSKFFLDNQGVSNANAGNSNAFSADKSAAASDPVIPINGVVLESTRSITSINNGTLFLTSSDLTRINNSKSIQYNFKLSVGYQVNSRFFAETGFDLRDEFKNNPVLLSVSSRSNSITASNQYKITNYQLQQTNYSPQLALIGLLNYNLRSGWSIFGRIMAPSFKSNRETILDQQFAPQNGSKPLLLNKLSVNTASFGVGARFRF